jgi:hypothetical protein
VEAVRLQLRDFYQPDEVARVYSRRYDHTLWGDHVLRVRHTAQILREMAPASVADLSCGDAAIVEQAGLQGVAVLGDMVPGWPVCGPIERTIQEIDPVDVFVCSETLEHIQDPDALLTAIRKTADRLLLSTPVGESDDRNPEHYWGWDVEDLDEMLSAAGWSSRSVEMLHGQSTGSYTFQIWRCSQEVE